MLTSLHFCCLLCHMACLQDRYYADSHEPFTVAALALRELQELTGMAYCCLGPDDLEGYNKPLFNCCFTKKHCYSASGALI